MGYNASIHHLQVGCNPFANHFLNSWDIQVYYNELRTDLPSGKLTWQWNCSICIPYIKNGDFPCAC